MSDHLEEGGGPAARLDARLASLETRLQMLETAMRSEVDRVHLAVEQMDGAVSEMRSTIGDARNLADLANSLGDRLGELANIDRNVTGAAQRVADEIGGRLESQVDRSRRVEEELQATFGAFAERMHALERGLEDTVRRWAEQPSVESHLAPFAERLDVLAGGIRALHERPQSDPAEAITPIIERIDRIAAELTDARTTQPQMLGRLDQLAAELADLRSTRPDLDAALGPIVQRLEALGAGLAELRESRPELTAQTVGPIAERLDQIASELGQELAELRAGQPKTMVRLDQVAAELADLRNNFPAGEPPAAVVERLELISQRLDTVDARTAGAMGSLADLHASGARTAEQVAQVVSALSAIEDAGEGPERVLAPVIDRLAIVLDGLTSVSANIEHLAGAIGALRAERPAPALAEINARLDDISTTVAGLQTSRPDVTSSLQALAGLIESVRTTATESQQRLDALTSRAGSTDARFDDVLAGVGLAVDQIEATAAAHQHAMADLATRLDARSPEASSVGGAADAGALSDAIEQTKAALSERIDAIRSDLSGQVGAAVEGLKAGLDAATHAPADAEGIAAVADRINAVRDELTAQITEALNLIRSDLAPVSTSSSTTDALTERLEAVRISLSAEISGALAAVPSVSSITDSLAARVDSVRAEVGAGVSESLTSIRDELQRTRDELARGLAEVGRRGAPDTGAAVAATAAEALTRLEGRMDTEFDTVARQLDALGSLVHHTIEAVDRIESQIVGVQPVTERMRTAASRTIDVLRETSRQRLARRAAPPELNR